jgi:hypothetical protein
VGLQEPVLDRHTQFQDLHRSNGAKRSNPVAYGNPHDERDPSVSICGDRRLDGFQKPRSAGTVVDRQTESTPRYQARRRIVNFQCGALAPLDVSEMPDQSRRGRSPRLKSAHRLYDRPAGGEIACLCQQPGLNSAKVVMNRRVCTVHDVELPVPHA